MTLVQTRILDFRLPRGLDDATSVCCAPQVTHTLGFTLQHAAADGGETPDGLLLAAAHLVKAGIVGLDAILGHTEPNDEAMSAAADAGAKVRGWGLDEGFGVVRLALPGGHNFISFLDTGNAPGPRKYTAQLATGKCDQRPHEL